MKSKSAHKYLWVVFALIVGVSVPYFFISVGTRIYESVLVNFGFAPSKEASADALPNLGSDDTESKAGPDVPEGSPVMVNPATSGQYYFEGPNYKVPNTSGLAYEVADVDTGEVIIEKNQNVIFPIASVSKLTTAIVAKEHLNPHGAVTVSRSSIDMYGSSGGLALGEKILVSDLYYPLLMESSNDAAEVFAEAYGEGYDAFIKLMNQKAAEIGMVSTSYFEPSGLSEKNVSTASDLVKLAEYITKNYPDIWDVTRVRQYSILHHSWSNSSSLSRKPEFIGGKNGFTYEAFDTAVVVLNIPMEGGPRRIAITLLKSNAREADVNALEGFVSKWVGFLPAGQKLPQSN